MSEWKKDFANEAEKAFEHELSQRVIDELLFNLRFDRQGLPYYGILKVCSVVAQVARAQALGMDPELLRMTEDEAGEVLSRKVEAFLASGKPVFVVNPDDDEEQS